MYLQILSLFNSYYFTEANRNTGIPPHHLNIGQNYMKGTLAEMHQQQNKIYKYLENMNQKTIAIKKTQTTHYSFDHITDSDTTAW